MKDPYVARSIQMERTSLQMAVLHSSLWSVLGVAVLSAHTLAATPGNAILWTVVLCIVPLSIAGLVASERAPGLVSVLVVLGLMATPAVAATVAAAPVVWSIAVVPVLLAGALLGPWAAPVAAAVACVWTLLGGVSGELATAQIALFGITGLVTWRGLSPVFSLLDQSLALSAGAIRLTEQVRDERGKLNRTVKALDDSYQLLEKTNRDLILARHEADALRDLRSRFATNLSHELRTPLNVILGFSQLIYTKPQLYGYPKWNEPLLRDLAEVRRNSGYLSSLLEDIMDLARVDALAMPVRREMCRIHDIIVDAIGAAKPLAEEKGIAILTADGEDVPELPLDPLRIRQVLYNLLTNAIRHTDAGRVKVSTELIGSEAVVSVEDTGCGIEDDALPMVFDEFYQVGRPRSRPGAGRGLGLAIARRFVLLHGGRIWAQSQVGSGSTFRFSLPLEGKRVSLSRPATPLPLPRLRSRPVVLIWNSDDTACGYLRRRIEGYDFLTVADEAAFREAATNARPVAVICNRSLADTAPTSLPPGLRDLLEDVAVIECALPGSRWLDAGDAFSAVLTKPVAAEELLSLLSRLAPPGRVRVLVADDDRSFVQMVGRILEAEPQGRFRVRRAYGGEEALAQAQRWPPDVLLLDLAMPDLSGFEVARRLRDTAGLLNLPIAAITATSPGEDRLAHEGWGLRLHKYGPLRPGELVRLIATELEFCGAMVRMEPEPA